MAKIKVTYVKSSIGYDKSHRRTILSLGLHKLHQSVVHEDGMAIRGMINKVRHLVMVEEASD